MPAVQNPNIAGVQIKIFVHGTKTELQPDEQGLIGKLAPQKLKLAVWVTSDDVEALSVIPESSGCQSVRFMKNHAEEGHDSAERFAQKIQIHAGPPSGIAANQNCMVLTEALPGGRVLFHELSLVGDCGEFFLAHQVEEVQAFMGDAGPRLPALPDWRFEPGMIAAILGIEEPYDLPPFKEYRPIQPPSSKGLGSKEGVVEWWSDAKGMGTITTKDELVMVRRESFYQQKPGILNSLSRGQKVTFAEIGEVKYRNRFYDQAFGLHVL